MLFLFLQAAAKVQVHTTLTLWDQTIREGQQSIVLAVCSRATCTEDRQRLERLSRSRQRSYLAKMKKHRQQLKDSIGGADAAIASGEAAAARGKTIFADLEENRQKLEKILAKATRLLIEHRLIISIFTDCFIKSLILPNMFVYAKQSGF